VKINRVPGRFCRNPSNPGKKSILFIVIGLYHESEEQGFLSDLYDKAVNDAFPATYPEKFTVLWQDIFFSVVCR
jgi:hypothetical protein